MRAKILVLLGWAVLTALPMPAAADEAVEQPGRLAAVQRRKFRMDHEIYAAASLLPLDAFYKGLGPAGSYTFHFSDTLAWEVVRGSYSWGIGTSLRKQLVDLGFAPTRFEQIQLMLSSAVMYTPLYGKFSMLNERVLHAEIFGTAGATGAWFTDSFKAGPQLGLGARVFLSESVSLRLDARYNFFLPAKIQAVEMTLGFSLNLGGTD